MTPLHLSSIGSTNDYAVGQALDGAPDGFWVYADMQSAGRGRHGRQWMSLPGNLFASTIIRPYPEETPRQLLSFVAALALHDALCFWVAPERLSLKWPNDVMLDAVKLSGILLETAGEAVVAGFGVNLAAHPQLDRPTASMAGAGLAAPSPQALLAKLMPALAQRRAQWRAQGFAAMRTDWCARASGLGTQIRVAQGAEFVTGVFEGLGLDGSLCVRLADGSRRDIHSGELVAG